MILKYKADSLLPPCSWEDLFTRLIAACKVGFVRIERFRSGMMGLLEVEAVYVYRLHTLTTILRHTLNRFVMSRLHIPSVFKATIRSRIASDAILLEVMFINERNNRHVCIRQLKSAVRKSNHFRAPTNL